MESITILDWYRLFKEDKVPAIGTFVLVKGTDEEYAKYQAENERDKQAFEARMEERRKIKNVPCANCGHLCGNHTLMKTCRETSSTGEMFCNCPDFVAA